MINETAKSTILIDGKQAEDQLKLLSAESKKYREEMKRCQQANDKAGFDKAKAQYDANQKAAKGLRTELFSLEKVMNNLSGASMNQLKAAQRAITTELNKMTRGTAEYIAKSKQLQQVGKEISKVKTEMYGAAGAQQGFFNRISNGFNKYFGMATAAVASLTGVVFGVRKAIDTFNTFEKSLSNLSALTGLEGDSLKWLGEQAKLLSTSTTESGVKITASATEIVEAYKLMGSAKPELLSNKEALNEVTKQALILKEAAGMETAPAITALANIMNQFNADASQASTFINVLAAGAKEGAAEIEDLSDSIIRSGAAATQANVTIEQEVALIETLAEKGIKAERAGTGLRGTILKMQKGSDEFNPKIVGMSRALDNLAAKHLSAKQMIELFGEENYTVAQILIQNRKRYDELTEAITGTNVATEQAVKNTSNNAAKLDQAKNKAQLMSMTLGEKLAPALTFSTNSFSYLLKAMLAFIRLFENHGRTILVITAAIASYTLALKAQSIWTWAVEKSTRAAKLAMNLFNKTTKISPIGLIIGLLSAAASAFFLFRKNVDKATKSQSDFNKAIKEGNDLMTNSKSIEERYNLIGTLNKRQTQQLKSDIENQLKAEEDYTVQLLQVLQKRFDEDETLKEFYQKRDESRNEYTRAWYSNQIKNRQIDLAKDLQAEQNKHNKSKKLLVKYLTDVKELLKKFPSDPGELDETGEKDDPIKILEREHQRRRLLIMKNYGQQLIDRQQFDQNMLSEDTSYLIAKMAILQKTGEDTTEVEQQIEQKKIDILEKSNQEKERKAEEWLQQWLKIKNQEREEENQRNEESLENYRQKMDQYKSITDQIGAQMGDAIGNFIGGNEDAAGEFGKTMVLTMLDAVHAVVRMSLAEIWAQSLAQPDSVATFGATGVARAMIISALVEAAFATVKGAISGSMRKRTSQHATGRYSVIGADDGQSYSASYGGHAKTGVYHGPTLVAEQGDELIVDNGTLRNVQINFPDVVPKIMASRVPQRAEGNIPAFAATGSTDPELKALIRSQNAMINTLYSAIRNGISANISYSNLKDKLDKGEAAENRGSRI